MLEGVRVIGGGLVKESQCRADETETVLGVPGSSGMLGEEGEMEFELLAADVDGSGGVRSGGEKRVRLAAAVGAFCEGGSDRGGRSETTYRTRNGEKKRGSEKRGDRVRERARSGDYSHTDVALRYLRVLVWPAAM